MCGEGGEVEGLGVHGEGGKEVFWGGKRMGMTGSGDQEAVPGPSPCHAAWEIHLDLCNLCKLSSPSRVAVVLPVVRGKFYPFLRRVQQQPLTSARYITGMPACLDPVC